MSSFPSPTPDAGSPGPGSPTALWVSTALDTRGGISSYVRMLGRTPLATRWSVRHIATHRDGSAGRKMLALGQSVGSGPPSAEQQAELARLQRRMALGARLAASLLVIAAAAMAVGRYV